MWKVISDKCSFYVVYFSGLKYPLSPFHTVQQRKCLTMSTTQQYKTERRMSGGDRPTSHFVPLHHVWIWLYMHIHTQSLERTKVTLQYQLSALFFVIISSLLSLLLSLLLLLLLLLKQIFDTLRGNIFFVNRNNTFEAVSNLFRS